jgi:hypothetical protein
MMQILQTDSVQRVSPSSETTNSILQFYSDLLNDIIIMYQLFLFKFNEF